MQEEIIVGRVGSAHGVRGWVRVHSFTVPVENILGYSPWELELEGGRRVRVAVADGRGSGKGCLVRFDTCRDRDTALGFAGADVIVHRDRLPALDEGEYYWADLIGCRVVAREGAEFGRVKRLIETGANDVLVVTGERERLIPFVPGQVILDVDTANSIIRVDWDADI